MPKAKIGEAIEALKAKIATESLTRSQQAEFVRNGFPSYHVTERQLNEIFHAVPVPPGRPRKSTRGLTKSFCARVVPFFWVPALIYSRRVGHNFAGRMVAIRRRERVLSIEDVKPNPNNARVHSHRQIGQIADSIKAFGFGAPVLVDETLTLIAGHGRLRAAELLGLKEIPAIELLGLSAARKRALALADNKIGDNAGWDRERLAIELPELSELLIEDGLDVSVTGFSAAEFDQLQVDFEEELLGSG